MTQPADAGRAEALARSSAMVGVGTALSRVTGLLRIGAVTYALGTIAVADAYNLANTTPNIVYELILGGILSATLVPVFVDRFEADDDDGVSAIVTVATVALVALTVIAVVAAPAIFRIYTLRKSSADARQLATVGVPLTRLFLPQILFYGLTAIGTALLNARRRFAAPALAPVLNNIVVCGALVLFARAAGKAPSLGAVRSDNGLLLLLGLGTTAGIVAMTVVLWWPLRRAGVRLRWRFQPRHPAVRKVASLSGWTVGYVVANQIALAVVLALAARRTGDASAYTYAFVFFQLPHGLFAVSLMTTFVPELSSLASRGDWPGYRARFALGLRWLVIVVVPAAVGYVVLARPLVAALLARGSLNATSAALVADILAALAIGLPGFSIYLFTLRGFYALKDTRTPFLLNGLENGMNILLAVALVGALHVQGLALAYAGAYSVAALVALVALSRRVGGVDGKAIGSSALRVGVAAAAMGLTVWAVAHAVGSNHGAGAVARVGAGVVVGAVVYGGVLAAVGASELRALWEHLAHRRVESRP